MEFSPHTYLPPPHFIMESTSCLKPSGVLFPRIFNGKMWTCLNIRMTKSPFKDVARQVLFEHPRLACHWRYFEVAAGGYSRSAPEHVHRDDLRTQALSRRRTGLRHRHPDLITVPPMTWHQSTPSDGPSAFSASSTWNRIAQSCRMRRVELKKQGMLQNF